MRYILIAIASVLLFCSCATGNVPSQRVQRESVWMPPRWEKHGETWNFIPGQRIYTNEGQYFTSKLVLDKHRVVCYYGR